MNSGSVPQGIWCGFEGRISIKSDPINLRRFAIARLVDMRLSGFSSVGLHPFLDDLGATSECLSCRFAGLIFSPIADERVRNLANGETVRTA